jgi:hypothetical protein
MTEPAHSLSFHLIGREPHRPYDGYLPASAKTRPAPAFVVPMAAQPVTELPEGDDWIYEIKWDGYRALLVKEGTPVHIRSRNAKDLTCMYPRVAAAALQLKADRAVIDGEIVALGPDGKPSLQALQHRGSNPTHQIVFYAFDVLHVDGRDVTGEPLAERRAMLASIVGQHATLRLSQVLPGTAADVVTAVRAAGLEGVIAKRKDSVYQPGERSADWVKLKLERQQVRGTCNCRVTRFPSARRTSAASHQTALRVKTLKIRTLTQIRTRRPDVLNPEPVDPGRGSVDKGRPGAYLRTQSTGTPDAEICICCKDIA